jgi:ATP-dependent DNA helicase RecQ
MVPQGLLDAVAEYWGFTALRPLQAQAIAAALADRDSLVVLPTGGGKSLCYQAPAVYRGGLTVVVSPLIALMKDQVDGLIRNGVPAVRLDSSLTDAERKTAAALIKTGTARLAFVSPEKLLNTSTAEYLRANGAHTIAVDEAHCVSHWGHDFRPEYRQLGRLREVFPDAAVHAYTATATERVREDIVAQLGLRDPEVLVGNFDRPNLTFRILPQTDRLKQIREVIDRHRGRGGIVYCLRRADVDEVTAALVRAGYSAVPYHAGMTPDDRKRTQEAFLSEAADVVVATVAFGMGIDRPDVRFVVHAAVPKSLEHYQQETGRAGRDGLPSECVLLFSWGDVITFRSIIEKSAAEAGAPPETAEAAKAQLDAMALYCRGATCRHKAIVRHFGQEYPADNCGACDICLGDTQDVPDATVVAQKIISCVARVKEGFGANHVIDVLRGAKTQAVFNRGHDRLSTYGLLKDAPKEDVRDWIYQLVGQDLLWQEVKPVADGEVRLLRLNKASWQVLKGERPAKLIQVKGGGGRKGRRGESADGLAETGELPAGADPELFEALRGLRREIAGRLGAKPYQVFHDAVLAEFARGRPGSLNAMRRVSGVGDKKLADFGPEFLKVITDHCRRTGQPTDVPTQKAAVVRAAPAEPPASNRANPRRDRAFELFRGGAAVDDVIHQTGVTRTTAFDYLAEYVRAERPESIFAWVPEDVCERVAAAAEEHGTDRLKPVYLALNEEVGYDAIRVVFAFLDGRRAG